MTTCTPSVGPKGRMTIGVLLIALGLILLLDHAGIVKMGGLVRWWPLFLIGAGIVKIRQPIEDGQRAVGIALLCLGGVFLWFSVLSWGKAWPLLLIVLGAFLLWQAFERPDMPRTDPSDSSLISELAFIGGIKRGIRSSDLRGGYVTAVMGGIDLDLRKAKIATSPAYVDVVAIWGGIEIRVPAEWVVEGRVVPFMGGFENKTQSLIDRDDAPRLVVRGTAVMGGVTISN